MGDHSSSSPISKPTRLLWPEKLRVTRKRQLWFARLAALPANLTLRQVTLHLQEPYASVSFWCNIFQYPFVAVPRGRKSTVDWDAADWSRKNCDLARDLGVSGERVRQIRMVRHLPPTQKQTGGGKFFRDFVRVHKRRLHGMSIRQMIAECGAAISTATAYTILKAAGVRLRQHLIPWSEVNWALSNSELARVWYTHASYVAKVRQKLEASPAQWDGDVSANTRDPSHAQALSRERRRARSLRRKPRKS